ncbi:Rpn family recombination-promoting nuclease/putative transposase [Anaerovibrio sp.]|uniref:Rpn family recombination-promoting nuclease/putative transposase n=1 Tax=Anaerovibrio sp. TaxID=1872532 RepID=UPI0025BC401D|nr:Rpn family recombination-promoting nuclease/putative transposase [Anaerovibrio sp.]MBR2143819.1 Rpn family recombination-promoting nuclease/putative transposase [Anaerovibrio sp.]
MLDFRNAAISNTFMFRLVMEKPELCKQLLERVLGVKIKEIIYPEGEKSLEAQLTSKGIRLDIYVTLADSTVIDVEMQVNDSVKDYLGKRTRYYQSVLDNDALKKGELYSRLRKTYIIFICTFDPFEVNLAKYTFSSRCHENSELSLNDEVYKIFLNTQGDRHRISQELSNLLDYIASNEPNDDFTRSLQKEVELQRDDDGKRALYMTYTQTLLEAEDRGLNKGREEGKLEIAIDLFRQGAITEEVAANAAGISVEELRKAILVS